MIRMGRSSKPDETDTSNESRETPATAYSYQNEYGSSKAMSESEAMARDIKDGKLNGFVGHGTVLTGETYFNSMLRVDGQMTGKVMSEDGTLIVGSTGQVDADVTVAGAVINGTVNGDITASEKLELGRTARVIGNISAPRLLIEDGAILEGSCSMIQSMEIKQQEAAAALQQQTTYEESAYETESETETEEVEETASAYSTSSYSYQNDDDDDDDDEEEDDEAADAAVL
jgi:cytoskeletal protein CcmA (bactofilin family)